MTTRVHQLQSRCRVGFARADITPPVGIYHRMWGAAMHEQATGVHRPLLATALCLEPTDGSGRWIILGLDHCLLDPEEFTRIRTAVSTGADLPIDGVMIAMSHTHGSAWMSRSRADLPGGDQIGPYLDAMTDTCVRLAIEARDRATPATLLYAKSRCSLAAHRDFRDVNRDQIVCGFNPDGPADDTVLTVKAVAEDGRILGTVVNYACHPTTLAWENTLISPDYIGAMREVIERETADAPCLFLQGASGELGPREGFVGDPAIADRNGRQLGFAALAGLESTLPPGTDFAYAGAVVSGATLGVWKPVPTERELTSWWSDAFTVELAYRLELPTEAETRAALAEWQEKERQARAANDLEQVAECRARAERMTRQLARLESLPPGKSFPFRVWVARLGDGLWVFVSGELYQYFQVVLRERFPNHAIIVSTVTNNWQPGYLPSAASYGYGIYQEVISSLSPGCLETLTEAVSREITRKLQAH